MYSGNDDIKCKFSQSCLVEKPKNVQGHTYCELRSDNGLMSWLKKKRDPDHLTLGTIT